MAKNKTEDLYAVLGLPGGVDAAKLTPLELKKAYRKRAIECHPDKRAPEEKAAAEEEFHRLQDAYAILSDEAARKAYHDVLLRDQLEQEKLDKLSAKRRKMTRDLEEREAAFEAKKELRKQKERTENALQQEMERIRAAARAKRAAVQAQSQQQWSSFPASDVDTSTSWMDEEDKQKTLKVSWDNLAGESRYDGDKLRNVFEKFGGVEDVIIEKRKSRKKGSAFVIMETPAAAHAATQSQCGDLSNPLLVLPLDVTWKSSRPVPKPQPPSPQQPAYNQLNEESVFEKLRKAEERKRKAQAQPHTS